VNTSLVSTTSMTFKMGADDKTVLDPNGNFQRVLNFNIYINNAQARSGQKFCQN